MRARRGRVFGIVGNHPLALTLQHDLAHAAGQDLAVIVPGIGRAEPDEDQLPRPV